MFTQQMLSLIIDLANEKLNVLPSLEGKLSN